MRGVNYVCLSGNIGADPELRHTKSGKKVVEFRLASTRKFTREGALQEETEWTTITAWQQRAEFASAFLHKGDPVIIQGRLHTETWANASGEPRSRTTVIAHEIHALPRPDWRGRSDSDADLTESGQGQPQSALL